MFEVILRSSHYLKCSVYVLTREIFIMPKEVKTYLEFQKVET